MKICEIYPGLADKLHRGPDEREMISPDCYLLNDIYGDKVAARIAQNAKGKEKLRIFIDHVVPSDCPETDAKQVKLREFAEKNGIEFEEGQGVAYPMLLEKGLAPGQVVVGSGTHISCCGAAGGVPLCVCEEELAEGINEDFVAFSIPEAYVVELRGKMKRDGEIRSLAFWLLNREIPKNAALLFYLGADCILDMDERAALCTAMGTGGFRTVSFIPGALWQQYIEDKGAEQCPDLTVDLSVIDPMVEGPFGEKARPLSAIEDKPIKSVFIGGCMGGNYLDIRTAAKFMKGKRIAKNLRVLVVPNTQKVYLRAVEEGLITCLEESGVMVMNPHCSSCWGKAQGHVMDDEAAVTTGYKTYAGCLGSMKAQVYAVSVRIALECAVTGLLGGRR